MCGLRSLCGGPRETFSVFNLHRADEVVTRQSSDWSQAPNACFSNEMEESRHACLDAARQGHEPPSAV